PPFVADGLADHGFQHTVGVRGIAPGEAPLDAGVSVIGLPGAIRRHAHHFHVRALAAHLGLEATAHTAVRAGGVERALGLAEPDDRLLGERPRWTRLRAPPRRDALLV